MTRRPLAWLEEELQTLDQLHMRRHLRTHFGPQTAEQTVDGQRFVNFGGNDYLGLAADPRLAAAAIAAIENEGWGSGASPLVTGHGASHAALETSLAELEGTEAALLFSSGFAANVGTITALAGKGDVIFSDAKNHASIIDGVRLCGARPQIYQHLDVDHLEKLIAQASAFRRRYIVTDTLFSMDGDFAPLVELCELAERYDAIVIVDEAHATGVFGQHGRGVCEHLGVEEQVDVRIGTLSKALGGHGGFVVGSQTLIDWLLNRARSYVFSTAAPMAASAAMIAALQIVRDEPERRQLLLERAANLRETLRKQGWQVGGESQIIPILIGEPEPTMQASHRLREQGLFVPGIRPPSVPSGESLLRISLSYAHTPEHLDRLIAALADLRQRLL
ncbi:8-amino-7-oxononanoate synthase [Blastopirellula sp. JC732]|uniref:8-amino-7-ketopelargonate synthase n=1 Tax=Blastopirellula sediminis TaxID=2894196 RepID=A0A9X1MN09_9BACT|nr:8-amino-7-oxononanoate synthase [Blastopirellula sediminis]MCC9607425.1 8-amino-7-oxononanoate synthase [Blastopirellula sediminis]MCC9629282.1 8-amino-7-oxononanoate synthase [Blastopirellula sediminis]